MYSMRDLESVTAYIRMTAELARKKIDEVGFLAADPADLDSYGRDAIERATQRYGTAMRDHLELAIRYGDELWHAVNSELRRCADRQWSAAPPLTRKPLDQDYL